MSNPPQALPDIRHTVILKAPVAKVWNTVATSEGIEAWFMPNDFQPVNGSTFSLQTPYGTSPCIVTALEPPSRLAFQWGEEWLITFELKEVEGGTEFTLTHSGWLQGQTIAATGEKHDVVRDRMNNGWNSIVHEGLVKAVES